jgi:small conductance mechanosensitive channel
MQQIDSWFQTLGIDVGNVLGDLLLTLMAFAAARWISRRVRSRVMAALSQRAFARNDAILIGRLVSISIYGVATVVTLVAWGVNSTGILTALGAFSVALGLSLQDVFRNFFSGLLLLMEKPFKVGDHVQVQTVQGEVLGIDIRTTLVRTVDGSTVMVPNSIMYSQILTTTARRGASRLDLSVTGKEMDIAALSSIITRGAEASAVLVGPQPVLTVTSTSSEASTVRASMLISSGESQPRRVIESIVEAAGTQAVEVTTT